MKLRKNEYCPIHHSRSCWGGQRTRKQRRLHLGASEAVGNDHPGNIQAVHRVCNSEKGSRRQHHGQDQVVLQEIPTTTNLGQHMNEILFAIEQVEGHKHQ